jgi:hypothetical protein
MEDVITAGGQTIALACNENPTKVLDLSFFSCRKS